MNVSIIILLCTFFALIAQAGLVLFMKFNENVLIKKPTKRLLVAEFIIGFLIALFAFVFNKVSGEQVDKIQATTDTTYILSKHINTLEILDSTLTTNIDSITAINKQLSEEIKTLSEKSNQIIDTISSMVSSQREESALTGIFEFDLGRPVYDSTEIKVEYGTVIAINTIKRLPDKWWSGMSFIKFKDGFEPITFDVKNRKLVVSVDIYDLDGNLLVRIKDNVWRRYDNNTGQFNYNKNGFEIFDNRGNIALNIKLKNGSIKVQGYLIERERNFILIGGTEHSFVGEWGDQRITFSLDKEVKRMKSRQIFRYTGEKWLHSMIE